MATNLTPPDLAARVVGALARQGLHYRSILEPTCGQGSLLLAAAARFGGDAVPALGFDINPTYLEEARHKASLRDIPIRIRSADFFQLDWEAVLGELPSPLLIIGNPPWVASAAPGIRGSINLPKRSNSQRHRGFDAVTGKSNFDISEWMLLQHLDWLTGRTGTIAMLIKYEVARKTLQHIWRSGYPCSSAHLYFIDARKHFGAGGVEVCLLLLNVADEVGPQECHVYDTLEECDPSRRLGFYRGDLVSCV